MGVFYNDPSRSLDSVGCPVVSTFLKDGCSQPTWAPVLALEAPLPGWELTGFTWENPNSTLRSSSLTSVLGHPRTHSLLPFSHIVSNPLGGPPVARPGAWHCGGPGILSPQHVQTGEGAFLSPQQCGCSHMGRLKEGKLHGRSGIDPLYHCLAV